MAGKHRVPGIVLGLLTRSAALGVIGQQEGLAP
jgi:hypothetical protein